MEFGGQALVSGRHASVSDSRRRPDSKAEGALCSYVTRRVLRFVERLRLPGPLLGPVVGDDGREAQKEGDMTETYDQVITSEEQVASVKAALTAGAVDVSLLTPFWAARRFATADLAVRFANEPPAQKAGEAVFSVGDDGVVYGFYYLIGG
jgi:hypothetical protein